MINWVVYSIDAGQILINQGTFYCSLDQGNFGPVILKIGSAPEDT